VTGSTVLVVVVLALVAAWLFVWLPVRALMRRRDEHRPLAVDVASGPPGL
jgi:hypothetical protein